MVLALAWLASLNLISLCLAELIESVMHINYFIDIFFMWQAMHGAPLYIAETCPSQIRGTLISLKELFIVLGILVC